MRYRGIAKNAAQVLTLFALSNLWMPAGNCVRWGRGDLAVWENVWFRLD